VLRAATACATSAAIADNALTTVQSTAVGEVIAATNDDRTTADGDVTRDPATGLTSEAVRRRLTEDGPNLLPEAARPHPLRELARQLTHLLAALLWVASALALLAGVPELAVAIVVIVLINAAFAFWQEYRADRSTQRLKSLLPTWVRVVRDGDAVLVDATGLVRGDLVMLAAGDRIGADMTVEVSEGLRLDESMVTGESSPVPHTAGDRLMTGSFVVQGEGRATVVATGEGTTLADISKLADSATRPPSPLTVQLDRVVRVVAVVAMGTGVLLGVSALVVGLGVTDAFLFGVGVSVALIPEGLLPTVTLSLARGARLMADRQALVRRLDAVETLGATTFICTDKTGTLTQNRMSVVDVVTLKGRVTVEGEGYHPTAELAGPADAVPLVRDVATAAASCVTGRVVERDGWVADGDPMEAALDCLARRVGAARRPPDARRAYSPERLVSSARTGDLVAVLGAPEAVRSRCADVPAGLRHELDDLTGRGRRVLAVGSRTWQGDPDDEAQEHDLVLLGLLGLEDPPRPYVAEALAACRRADIRVAMITGDHPRTAAAIATEVGLLRPGGAVFTGGELPADDAELAEALDNPAGAVVARGTPADKYRIARALRERGHVVAMTGDGVNDAPALREADVGVAMGATGSDVAREAADLVLLDDHFGTIVAAIELGRATFHNVRRFLTYHLTDNVAELAPFAAWALTAGSFPLAIGVLQVLALDIGTDMLPALALGAEPPSPRVLEGRHRRSLVDRPLLVRAFGVLGSTEAVMSLSAFAAVLLWGGWSWGETPDRSLLMCASGTAFAAIAVAQMGNAFACRSTVRPVWRLPLLGNPLLVAAVGAEVLLLAAFLGVPYLAGLLGGSWPTGAGWAMVGLAGSVLVVVDGLAKTALRSPDAHGQPPTAPTSVSRRRRPSR
jgi:magnesium-transporting ATPase (P-type)